MRPASLWLALSAVLSISVVPRAFASNAEGRGRIVVVGVDGMTFDVLDPLVAAGKVPHLAAILARGARAVLRSERPMRSPALWTTIATGQPRKVHGIYDFVTGSGYWPKAERDVEARLVTSDMRRAPALWTLANRADRSAAVVGWLNTWPAETIDGAMVAPYVALGMKRQTSIKGKIYDRAERQYAPAELADRLARLVVKPEEVTKAIVATLVDSPPPSSPLHRVVPSLRRYLYTVHWSLAAGLTNVAMVEALLRERPQTDLVMTYLDGADTLGHRFWLLRQPLSEIRARLEAQGIPAQHAPELKRRFGSVIDAYYGFVDAQIGRLRAAAGPEATFLILSDHGWGSHTRTAAAPHADVPFDGEHRMNGVLIAAGPAIVRGSVPALTHYEVAPTVLYLLGAGLPTSLPGGLATELILPAYLRAHSEVQVAGGTQRRRPARAGPNGPAPFEDQELERLRSLGYVQ